MYVFRGILPGPWARTDGRPSAALPDVTEHEAANAGDRAEEDGQGRDLLLGSDGRVRRTLRGVPRLGGRVLLGLLPGMFGQRHPS